jgi:hypothetical protein
MPLPPPQLDGASVLCWASTAGARHTARTTHRAGGLLLAAAPYLAICQYPGQTEYYLFYCDAQWNVQTDTAHATVEAAKDQAEFEYEGVSAFWSPRSQGIIPA